MLKNVKFETVTNNNISKNHHLACLFLIGLSVALPMSSIASESEPPKILAVNRTFIVDGCQDSLNRNGDTVLKNCNFFVRNYADASLEIYDKNNKLIRFEQLLGARPTSSLVEATWKGSTNLYHAVTSEYVWYDARNEGGNTTRKTSIAEIIVPNGGKMVVTQSSNTARMFNYLNIGIDWADKLTSLVVSNVISEYIKSTPNIVIKYSQTFATAITKKDDVKEIIKACVFTTIDVLLDSGMKVDVTLSESLHKAASGLSKLTVPAEATVLLLNTTGQIVALDRAKAKDTTLTFNNTFKKVERFSDFPSNSRYYPYLHDLEVKGFKFPAQNWDAVDEPEKFGADEKVKKREFFVTLKQIIKKTKLDAKKSYADIYNYDSFDNSVDIKNSDIFFIAEALLSKAFGDEYYSCVNKNVQKAAISIIKKEDGFEGGALSNMKNLYKAGVISYNRTPTDKKYADVPLTREESLELYSNLYKAIERGKNRRCSV